MTDIETYNHWHDQFQNRLAVLTYLIRISNDQQAIEKQIGTVDGYFRQMSFEASRVSNRLFSEQYHRNMEQYRATHPDDESRRAAA